MAQGAGSRGAAALTAGAEFPRRRGFGAHRSSTFPSLRWLILHDIKPGGLTAAQGIDLGLQLGLERLGLRDPRLGAARVADIAGEWRSRSYWLPETTRSGAKGLGKGGKAHQGSWWPELQRKMSSTMAVRRERSGPRGQAATDERRDPGRLRSLQRSSAKVQWGLRGTNERRWRRIGTAERLTDGRQRGRRGGARRVAALGYFRWGCG
jgi:hypothetical protein